ncbi:hypothetical protein VNO77_34417 [Canavalia gladiata]|uniref:Uncharacterized protein n=1 Tax=Canavalia gladiata TaxID=3824 RepID=A0AAN9KE94_CANGL
MRLGPIGNLWNSPGAVWVSCTIKGITDFRSRNPNLCETQVGYCITEFTLWTLPEVLIEYHHAHRPQIHESALWECTRSYDAVRFNLQPETEGRPLQVHVYFILNRSSDENWYLIVRKDRN